MIGACRNGDFSTPELKAVKKRILIKDWGKHVGLGSWKQVLDTLGANVAYAALRQGRLPYVPHSLLLPGHNVKWPESHELVLTKKYWNTSWRDEVEWRTDDEDPDIINAEVQKWLKKRQGRSMTKKALHWRN